MLCECFKIEWDGIMIRRPSMLLIIDDLGYTNLFKNDRGELYKLMVSSRHLSVMSLMFSLHDYVNMYK